MTLELLLNLAVAVLIVSLLSVSCAPAQKPIQNCLDYDPLEYTENDIDTMISAGDCRMTAQIAQER
jgi:hypothetical protein